MEESKNWPNIENKKRLTESDAKFIFEQAEKQLKEILSAGDLVASRSTNVITLVSGLLIALVGYAINQLSSDSITYSLIVVAFGASLYLILVLIYIFQNIKGIDYGIIGSPPNKLLIDTFFIDSIPKEERIIRFYVSEIENYQVRIDKNKMTNAKRWKIFNRTIFLLTLIPVVLLLFYLISKIIPLEVCSF